MKPEFNNEVTTRLLNEYKGGHRTFPVAEDIVEDFSREYSEAHNGVKFSERRIVDENGKDYGMGVYLDSERLDGISSDELKELFIKEVKRLGNVKLVARDNNGDEFDIYLVPSSNYINHNKKKRQANKDLLTKNSYSEVKKEVVLMLDEVLNNLTSNGSRKSTKSHGWIDNNGENDWSYYKTYVQDKNNDIYEIVLDTVTSKQNKQMLYDVEKPKKVGRALDYRAHSLQEGIIYQNNNSVKGKMSERTEATDTRTLLSNALETTAQNDIERKYIAEYKQDINSMGGLLKF